MIVLKGHNNFLPLIPILPFGRKSLTYQFKIVTHKKGFRNCNLFPLGKKPWNKDSLTYSIRFTESCLYPSLPVSPITGQDENASWNKLIYLGSFNPHFKASSFGWRHYKGKLEICARFYDNDSGDDFDHHVLWTQKVEIDHEYILSQMNTLKGHVWLFNGEKVASYDEPMPSGWLSAPWFGGGPGWIHSGNVPNQNLNFDLEILKKI